MNLYAFLNRFGSWSQPFLAHNDEEVKELIKASLKGKELSYSDHNQGLYKIAFYRIDSGLTPLENVSESAHFICMIEDLVEQGSVEDADA